MMAEFSGVILFFADLVVIENCMELRSCHFSGMTVFYHGLSHPPPGLI